MLLYRHNRQAGMQANIQTWSVSIERLNKIRRKNYRNFKRNVNGDNAVIRDDDDYNNEDDDADDDESGGGD